ITSVHKNRKKDHENYLLLEIREFFFSWVGSDLQGAASWTNTLYWKSTHERTPQRLLNASSMFGFLTKPN
ncbi:hypothetical protein J0J21_23405, partial [Vibrio vulnificus]|uniref:hypothetical protein n=1 Tax=Vibrio vulnificus TaxID=672 RepID=UPI0019D4D41A